MRRQARMERANERMRKVSPIRKMEKGASRRPTIWTEPADGSPSLGGGDAGSGEEEDGLSGTRPETGNPKPEPRNPNLETRNPNPETRTRSPKPEARNPTPHPNDRVREASCGERCRVTLKP
jgi:hypothetical protein